MIPRIAIPLLLLLLSSSSAQLPFVDSSHLLANPDLKSGVLIAVADMNNDGLDDLVRLDNARSLEVEYQQGPGETFTRYVFGETTSTVREWAIAIADTDNNGFNDILVGGDRNGIKLLRANPTGTAFTSSLLPDSTVVIQTVNFVDIDNDGISDIFVCNDVGENLKYTGGPGGTFTRHDALLDTRGVPASPGESEDNSGNYASLWSDLDNDNDLDLYISKCRQGVTSATDPRRINLLFENDGNHGFSENSAGANLDDGAQTWCSALGDIDNDGDFDLFILNHIDPSRLLENDGGANFTDVTTGAGFTASDFAFLGVQAGFVDFDNDGFLDLFLTSLSGQHRLFRNDGDSTFTRIDNAMGTDRIRTFATGDLNSDGFPDIIAGYGPGTHTPSGSMSDRLWTSVPNANHWLAVRLRPTASNPNAIGARLTLQSAVGTQIREVRSGESYAISNSFTQHFGLGSSATIDRLTVRWPSGVVDEFLNPAPDQFLTVTEGSSPPDLLSRALASQPALRVPAALTFTLGDTSGITYRVQTSEDAAPPWTTVATKNPGSPWESSATVSTDGPAVTITDIPSSSGSLFVRLSVSTP